MGFTLKGAADRLRRLMNLARKSATLAEFVLHAAKFPRFFGFPGTGTRPEWETFFKTEKQKP